MKRTRTAVLGAIAVAVLCAGWAVLAWETGFGGKAFMQPGTFIADLFLAAGPGEPFEAKSASSVAEGFAQLVLARGIERGLQVWRCAVAFWLVLVPALTFLCMLGIRRHGA
jgi:hypothetical protein